VADVANVDEGSYGGGGGSDVERAWYKVSGVRTTGSGGGTRLGSGVQDKQRRQWAAVFA
jgi:hypothetical protein